MFEMYASPFELKSSSSDVTTPKNLTEANIGRPYRIVGIETEDEDMRQFLFTLGCYEGEMVTVISVLADNFVVAVKDARYSVDRDLAEAIKLS